MNNKKMGDKKYNTTVASLYRSFFAAMGIEMVQQAGGLTFLPAGAAFIEASIGAVVGELIGNLWYWGLNEMTPKNLTQSGMVIPTAVLAAIAYFIREQFFPTWRLSVAVFLISFLEKEFIGMFDSSVPSMPLTYPK